MHGSVMSALRSYITAEHGTDGWRAITSTAGVEPRTYVPAREYPDQEAVALLQVAAAQSGLTLKEFLERFGEVLAPQLLKLYRAFIPPEWTALDLVENVESTIHRIVRMRNPGADPPHLECSRPSADRVVVVYTSERRMCGLALGLLRGIASEYKELLEISEDTCMLDEDACCTISVRRLSSVQRVEG